MNSSSLRVLLNPRRSYTKPCRNGTHTLSILSICLSCYSHAVSVWEVQRVCGGGAETLACAWPSALWSAQGFPLIASLTWLQRPTWPRGGQDENVLLSWRFASVRQFEAIHLVSGFPNQAAVCVRVCTCVYVCVRVCGSRIVSLNCKLCSSNSSFHQFSLRLSCV